MNSPAFTRAASGLAALLLTTLTHAAPVAGAPGSGDWQAVRDRWALINYKTPAAQKESAFEKLAADAAATSRRWPGRAEPLIWEGIVLSTYAGASGGLGALGLAKQAKARLEAALKIDPTALDGSAFCSLGTLYHKVPGFPLGFGSDSKARELLEKALTLNPDGIDPNYFYGEFLHDEGDHGAALRHLEKALRAAPRPGREVADDGRRAEIRALMAKVKTSGRPHWLATGPATLG
jgi:tetratricopeptide (TPR) repeat protein